MGCARLKTMGPRTLRELQTMADSGFGVYSCLETEKPQPSCAKERYCRCTDEVVEFSGEGFISGDAIQPCGQCHYLAEYLCDWPMGKGKTCDAPLCDDHALPAGCDLEALRPDDLAQRRDPEARRIFDRRLATMADLHYCPAHYAQAQSAPAAKPRKRRDP